MGGLPFWLLQKNPTVRLRSSDPKFLGYVDKWYSVLYQKLSPMSIGNGGPIIMLQIENEYGSYAAQTSHSDTEYLIYLRDKAKQYFGNSIVLFSTDGGKNSNAFDTTCKDYPFQYNFFGTLQVAGQS